jgi:transposase InsO family protein
MLAARHFTIFTDHKHITYAFQQKRDKCSPKQLNHLDFIAQFTTDICHIFGQDNVVADALSHVESVSAPPSYNAVATSQDSDDELKTFQQSNTSLRLEKLPIPGTTVSIYCDTSARRPRPYIPAPLQPQVFQSVHDLLRPGTKATSKLVAQRFVWPGVQKDWRNWARACQSCQCSKVSRHTVTPLGDFTPLAARFLQVLDLVRPLPTSVGYTYCLTAVDRFSRWSEVVPIPDISTDTMARALPTGWISRFCCLQTITTDQGRQFESQLFHSLAKLCGIQLSRTTAHHPAANKLVEYFHRALKAAIMYHADQHWTEAHPLFILGIRTAFKEDQQASTAELLYSKPLRIPGELLTRLPTQWIQHTSSKSSASIWAASDRFWQRAMPPRLHSYTATSTSARTSSSGRTPLAECWSPPL